jgi:long chain fatty acid CoA FadD26
MSIDALDAAPLHGATAHATLVGYLSEWALTRGDRVALTFVDHRADPTGSPRSMRWWELEQRVADVAHHLSRYTQRGDRVALIAPAGLDYVIGFLACLYAGRIAVPLPPPGVSGRDARLVAALADCQPACVLTTSVIQPVVAALADHAGSGTGWRLVAVDLVPPRPGTEEPAHPCTVESDDVAYLQYTSGSTRSPAGVMITHRNLLSNGRQALMAFAPDALPHAVSWLPLFHDMGLVLGIATPLLTGGGSTFMDPEAFLRSPGRWLRLLSAVPDTVSAAPNFAYDLCARRVSDEEKRALRLDRVRALLNGSEVVRAGTLARFLAAFGPCGLTAEMLRPSYGLAEATVFVAASRPRAAPTVAAFDRQALADGTAIPVSEEATAASTVLVSCGAAVGQQVVIVDPATAARCRDGDVGEVWVHGPNVSPGYWCRTGPDRNGFGATLADPGRAGAPDRAGTPLPTAPWLRTGDLGMIFGGELYITGRIKDLIVIDGRNYYPQDLEATVQDEIPAVREGRTAAFSIPVDEGEGVVVVAELPIAVEHASDTARGIRAALTTVHSVPVVDVALVRPGAIPRTTSGKVARQACRAAYLGQTLDVIGAIR